MALKDLAGVTRMAAQLPGELQKGQKTGVRRSALFVTKAIRAEIRAATGDSRLSGVGRRGARVGAGYDVKGNVNPTALITARGPLHLVERKTNPHTIAPRRRGRRKALALADGGFAAYANHPGTPAKRPFEKGYLRTRDQTGRIFDEEVQKSITRVLG